MEIYESAVYKNYPGMAGAVQSQSRSLTKTGLLLLVASLAFAGVAWLLWDPPDTRPDAYTGRVAAVISGGFFLLGLVLLGTAHMSSHSTTPDQRQLLQKLANVLGLELETVLEMSVDRLQGHAREKIVGLAEERMLHEEVLGWATNNDSVPDHMRTTIRNAVWTTAQTKKDQLRTLYEATSGAGLIPDYGYSWIFDKARRRRSL